MGFFVCILKKDKWNIMRYNMLGDVEMLPRRLGNTCFRLYNQCSFESAYNTMGIMGRSKQGRNKRIPNQLALV